MASKKGKGKFDQPPKIDSAEFARSAARVKENILDKLAMMGVEQKDIEHSMRAINKAVSEIETRVAAYDVAKPKTRESIEKQLRNLQKKLSGEISVQVEEAAKEVLKSKGRAVPAPAAAPAPVEKATEEAAPAEVAATPAPEEQEAVLPPMPIVPEPPLVVNEDAPLDTETLDRESMDEMRALLAKGGVGEESSSPVEEAEVVAPMTSSPTSLEDIFGDREVPASNAEMLTRLGKIKNKKVREEKIGSYLEKVAADEAENAAKKPKVESRGKSRKPKNEKPEALPGMPVVPPPPQPEAGQQPEKLDAKSAYSAQLSELENALKNRYPDWENAPSEVLERYFDLTTEQLSNNASGDKVKIEKTATDIDAFMSELQTSPVPVVPPPPATGAEDQTAQANEPEVDASEFAAPQYAKRGMQEEMDVLNESSPEPEPAVFRKNRERLIPTLTDVVETPQPVQKTESFVAPAPDFPYEASGNSRRAMYSQLEGVSPERAEALLVGDGPAPLEQEATRAETKSRLSSIIEKLTKMSGAVSEGFSKSKNYLNERAKQIDAQAETSGAERITRRMGEIYNKLNLREKLGIGLVLGASAVVTGGASIYLPYAFVGLIGVQRAFGMASIYLSQEKALQNAKIAESGQLVSLKERAAFDAVMSGALMGAAIGKGIQLANEYGLVERTREWLGSLMGHTATMPEVAAPARPSGGLPTSPDAVPPPAGGAAAAAAAAAGEAAGEAGEAVAAVPEAAAVEMPSVEAKAGDGYERMLKNLWEQTKGTTYPEGSDMARLQGIDPKDLSAEIHRLATDNEFFKATGESVRINIGDKLSVDANGDLWLNDQTILAPEGAPTTPALNPEVAPAASDASMRVEPSPDFPNEVTRVDADDMTGDVEIPSTVEEEGVTEHSVPSAESVAQPSAGEVGPHGFLSANGTPINPDVTHGYASPKGVYVFGGNVSDVQAQEYALANRVSVFVDKSTKILGGLVTLSRVVEFAPSEGGTTTMIIHHDPSLVPDPKTFTKILF